jgi:small subunit ribosomal protein S2
MAPFIYTQRNGIHIIDLRQTYANIKTYQEMVRNLSADGGTVLFVGTKRQAQDTVQREAERCNMPYVNQRWLGGTLTNWKTIRDRIDTLKKLEAAREKGDFKLMTKREGLILERKIEKLQLRLGGIRDMRRLPDVLLVVDTRREHTAVKEANILGIPVMALVDTNCNPDTVDYVIPANDDAMRAIKLLVSAFADAVIEGRGMRKDADEEEFEAEAMAAGSYDDDEDEGDERYLGESTLAKLREQDLFEEGDDDSDDDEE